MADIDVAEIERLLEACTTAPWTLNEEPERTYPGGDIDRGGWRIDAPGVEQLAFFWRDAQRWGPNPDPFGAKEAEANARLTAAAPAALRSLLSRVRALEAALEGLNDDGCYGACQHYGLGKKHSAACEAARAALKEPAHG